MIGVLAAFALLAIMAGIFMLINRQSENTLRGAHYDLWKDTLDQLLVFYEANIDCPATQAANTTPCSDGDPLEIRSVRSGQPTLINRNPPYSTIGEYEWRATCRNSNEILIEARPAGGITHPLRKRTWTEWADIYQGSANTCSL